VPPRCTSAAHESLGHAPRSLPQRKDLPPIDPAADIPIVALAEADLEAAERLVEAAGWNQTLVDWRMFLEDGRLWGCKDDDGQAIATAAAMPYRHLGWISLVLVDERWQRRGLATRLTQRAAAALDNAGLVPALDATRAGREVYLRMGFRDLWPLTRWAGDAPRASGQSGAQGVRPLAISDLPALVDLDLPCFAGGRQRLLQRLAQRSADFACVIERRGTVSGFLLGREGRLATHVGPVIAADLDAATGLLEFALAGIAGPVIVDVPNSRSDLAAWLVERGLAPQRPIVRMVRGAVEALDCDRRLYAVAGPDLG
jgi:GNAT superfamily N-acetyltransferase